MANQFSRRGPEDRIKKGHDEATKDKLRAEVLAKRLFKFAKAKGESAEKLAMSPTQVQAAKVLIDRGKPVLQAVEQKIFEEPANLGELEAQLRTLLPQLLEDPGLRAQAESILSGGPKPVDEHKTADKAA